MKIKNLVLSGISMALIGSLTTGTACGKNDCDDAADRITAKYDECAIEIPGDGDGDGDSAECTEQAGMDAQKVAGCTEMAACGALDGSDLDALLALGECLAS